MTKLTLISLVGFFAFMASMQINAEELYICPVDQVYKTGAGRSIDVELSLIHI